MFDLKKYNQINYIYLGFFLAVLTSVILVYRNLPFIDHDTVIYTIIGRDIFESFSMPYGRTFDHKPIFTYYIYGFFNYILNKNLYLIVSILCCLSSAFLLCKKSVNAFFVLSSFLILGSTLLSSFSGNTEMLMLPFISASLLLFKTKNALKFLAIGSLAAILFNINYLASVVMMPVTLYMFYDNDKIKTIKNISYFTCGLLISLFLIFLPFLFSDQNITDYFNQQFEFLTSYSSSNSLSSIIYISKFIFILSPIIIIYIYISKKDQSFYLNILLITGAILGTLASGHGFSHYLVPILIPASLMFLRILEQKKILALITITPLILATIASTIQRAPYRIDNADWMSNQIKKDIAHLNTLAKEDNTTLNIRTSHVIYLLSEARNINKYVFNGHADMIYGPRADNYYEEQINLNPHLIMTTIGMCDTSNSICDSIKEKYRYDSTLNHAKGYDLYVRTK